MSNSIACNEYIVSLVPLGLKFADIRSLLSQLKEISDLLNNLLYG